MTRRGVGSTEYVCVQDHVLQRAFTVEPMHALAATADGTFVAGGGASGAIYIWASGSGQLLRSWPAHYKVTPGVRDLRQSVFFVPCPLKSKAPSLQTAPSAQLPSPFSLSMIE